jgi:predicted GH43/DUF377 family glycosyl hydrolase
MADLARRFPENPLLRPEQVRPSRAGFRVECLLNPGVFRFGGRTFLLVRVAERPEPVPGRVRIPFLRDGEPQVLDVAADDPDLNTSDPREYKYRGEGYLSTVSHLRLFESADGRRFEDTGRQWHGEGEHESFGIEDCRVSTLDDGRYALTYTAVSANGYGVGLRTTRDWRTFTHEGIILPPANKDAAIFESTVGGRHYCLHRPSGVIVGGHYIWLGESPDLVHWGGHRCVARTRPGEWDGLRVGAGAAPIRTERGWLAIYHGAGAGSRYCLGALLLDGEAPWRVKGRSREPVMEPVADYERTGFFGNVVFTNGHVVDGDTVTVYYGAADSVICGATFSLTEILDSLNDGP